MKDDLENRTLIDVLSDYEAPQMTLSAVYSSRRHLPKKTQEFIAFVIEHLKK